MYLSFPVETLMFFFLFMRLDFQEIHTLNGLRQNNQIYSAKTTQNANFLLAFVFVPYIYTIYLVFLFVVSIFVIFEHEV